MSALWQRREELAAAVEAARARVGELAAEERVARGKLDRERGALTDYLRECEAEGLEPDPARVEELTAGVRAAAGTVRLVPVMSADPATGVPKVIGLDARDEVAAARVEGARVALERAERELAGFERERWAELVAELREDAVAAEMDRAAAASALAREEERRARLDARVVGLGRRTGAFGPEDVPDTGLPAEALRHVRRIAGQVREPEAAAPLPLGLFAEAPPA